MRKEEESWRVKDGRLKRVMEMEKAVNTEKEHMGNDIKQNQLTGEHRGTCTDSYVHK